MKQLDKHVVIDAARGNWALIYDALAPELDDARQKRGGHTECPVHGGQEDFRLFKDWEQTGGAICTCGGGQDGIAVLRWLKGWSFPEALSAVASVLGIDEAGGQRLAPAPRQRACDRTREKQQAEAERSLQKLRTALQSSQPASHPQARAVIRLYAESRGLDPVQAVDVTSRGDFWVHPRLAYWDRNKDSGKLEYLNSFPAILAVVRDQAGRPVTLHRTYLAPNGRGKAPVNKPKKLMAYPSDRQLNGAAIRLGGTPADGVLGLAEGFETALAVSQATRMTVWPTISSALMADFRWPEWVRGIVIWSDVDRSGAGQVAAERLASAAREKGVPVVTRFPPFDGSEYSDWLDVLGLWGERGFPQRKRVAQSARLAAA